MKDGDKMRKNPVGQLTKKFEKGAAMHSQPQRSASAPLPSPRRDIIPSPPMQPSRRDGRDNPVPHLLTNPLFIASGVKMPETSEDPYSSWVEEISPDLHVDVDTLSEASGSPLTHRRLSYGSFSTAIDSPVYDPEPGSLPHQFHQSEIEEVPDMNDYENPTGKSHFDLIGTPTPPPGYSLQEDPPIKRVIKEVHRIWVAPALAGIPAFVDNWLKTRQAKRDEASAKAAARGVGAALQGLKDRTLNLTPNQIFSARVAGSVLLFVAVAFLIYSFLEQRKRSHEVVFDASRYNLDRDRVITLIPKERYLLERAHAAREDALQQALPREISVSAAPLPTPYEYPPTNAPYRLRR